MMALEEAGRYWLHVVTVVCCSRPMLSQAQVACKDLLKGIVQPVLSCLWKPHWVRTVPKHCSMSGWSSVSSQARYLLCVSINLAGSSQPRTGQLVPPGSCARSTSAPRVQRVCPHSLWHLKQLLKGEEAHARGSELRLGGVSVPDHGCLSQGLTALCARFSRPINNNIRTNNLTATCRTSPSWRPVEGLPWRGGVRGGGLDREGVRAVENAPGVSTDGRLGGRQGAQGD